MSDPRRPAAESPAPAVPAARPGGSESPPSASSPPSLRPLPPERSGETVALPWHRRLSYRQARKTALLTFLVGMILAGFQVVQDFAQLRGRADAVIQQVMGLAREPAAEAAYAYDKPLAARILTGLAEYRPILSVAIEDDFGQTLAVFDRPRETSQVTWLADLLLPGEMRYGVPLIVHRYKRPVGMLWVVLDRVTVLDEFFDRLWLLIGTGVLWTVALAGILAAVFHLSISRPFMRLSAALAAIDPTRPVARLFDVPADREMNEFGLFARSINTLLLAFERALEQRREAEDRIRASEERLKLAVTATRSGVWDTDLRTGHVWRSEEFSTMLGYEERELALQGGWDSLLHPDDRIYSTRMLECHLKGETPEYLAICRMRHKDGSWLWIETRGRAIRDADGDPIRLTGTVTDVTTRKRYEEQLMVQATRDGLTGLPNRPLLLDRLSHALKQARRKGSLVGVLFIDLDRFKVINDSLGHDVGDRLLQAVATVLTQVARPSDTVGRLGGDEFLIIAENLIDPSEAGRLAAGVLRALRPAIEIDSHRLFASPSIGIDISSDEDRQRDGPTMLRQAETAMYSGKAEGGNSYRFFIPEMNREASARLAMEHSLRQALEQDQLLVHYQPRVEASTLRVVGLEALVRWRHPIEGLIPPGRFIPLAEETGLITPIGEWVLRSALKQIADWQRRGIPPLPVAVNVSLRQITSGSPVAMVRNALAKSGVAPKWLELEITESTMMVNPAGIADILRQLRDLGLAIAIDDFGTGYSSLSMLRRLPITTLKIDRSFIADATINADDAAIAATIVAMGHRLGLKVVAEGIETRDQMQFLRGHDCDEMQGFLFAKPLPVEELEQRFLAKDAWSAAEPGAETLAV